MLAIENHFVILLSVRCDAARFAPGLGFDAEHTRWGEDDVIDVPRLLAGFADFEIVEDADGIRLELIENPANDLLTKITEAVIGVAQDEPR